MVSASKFQDFSSSITVQLNSFRAMSKWLTLLRRRKNGELHFLTATGKLPCHSKCILPLMLENQLNYSFFCLNVAIMSWKFSLFQIETRKDRVLRVLIFSQSWTNFDFSFLCAILERYDHCAVLVRSGFMLNGRYLQRKKDHLWREKKPKSSHQIVRKTRKA